MSAPGSQYRRSKFLGIDPGRAKCGFAVVYDDGERGSVEVVPTAGIADRIDAEVRSGAVTAFCVGHATSSAAIVELCKQRWPEIPRRIVDETNTTLEARQLYFADHPPKGLWRLIPRGLLVPPTDLDGYAAYLIVERYRRDISAVEKPFAPHPNTGA
jgi:RNase H-fold protein (predicted Holliday junction resolvase)